jgi:hypothetical protein
MVYDGNTTVEASELQYVLSFTNRKQPVNNDITRGKQIVSNLKNARSNINISELATR